MEQFKVSFDAELATMIAEGRGLMGVWKHVHEGPPHRPHRFCPECDWPWGRGIFDLHMLLNDAGLWPGVPLLRPLFKALVYGEYRFSSRYCPLASHEERLTGHLISELSSALTVVAPAISERGRETYGQDVVLDFIYEDLARGGREAYTGADFGLVLFINLPGMPKPHIRWSAFQAKKIESGTSTARIELKQLVDLTTWCKQCGDADAGAYCFYDTDGGRGLAPTVARMWDVKQALKSAGVDPPDSYRSEEADRLGKTKPTVDAVQLAHCSLSEHLIFSMALEGAGAGARSLWEATSFLRRIPEGREEPAVRRLLVITLGSTRQQDIQDLRDLLRQ